MNETTYEYGPDFWREVNTKMREARADVEAGRVVDGEEVMNEIPRELEEESPE